LGVSFKRRNTIYSLVFKHANPITVGFWAWENITVHSKVDFQTKNCATIRNKQDNLFENSWRPVRLEFMSLFFCFILLLIADDT